MQQLKWLGGVGVLAMLLTACDGGGVSLNPSTTVTNSNNTTNPGGGGGDTNPCASYQLSGQTFQGSFDGSDCTYSNTFVADTRPLEVDVTINALDNDGLHIFEDSLFVGENINANAADQGVRVPQDGEGPTLTIEAGAKLAFFNSEDYVVINRGSRIIAEGTSTNPIIFSAVADLRDNQATLSDRGLWGGVQINGNGITNKCTDVDRQPADPNPHNCHVAAEGKPNTYGGTNNAENSGVLRFVQIRHAGFEVVDGDELNGLTLNAVGSGTTLEFVQVFTTLDDGFEMFGGAVNLKNVVGTNVGDDYIDYSEGWTGNVQFALLTHVSGSNRCIEADNTGSNRDNSIQPFTKGRISNMTCIVTDVDTNQGTAPSAKGDSEGPLFREGSFFELYNSIIVSSADSAASNECFELQSPETIAAVNSGVSVAAGNVIACSEALKSDDGIDIRAWWTGSGNAVVDAPADLPANLIIDLSPSNNTAFITDPDPTDANGAPIDVTVFDVTQLDDSFSADSPPALGSSSSFFEAVDFIGAVEEGSDWVSGWTTGL